MKVLSACLHDATKISILNIASFTYCLHRVGLNSGLGDQKMQFTWQCLIQSQVLIGLLFEYHCECKNSL